MSQEKDREKGGRWADKEPQPSMEAIDNLQLGGLVNNIKSPPPMNEMYRAVIPTRDPSWISLFFVYRGVDGRGKITAPRITVRKYQWQNKRWNRRASYNFNNGNEVEEFIKIVQAYYPEYLP